MLARESQNFVKSTTNLSCTTRAPSSAQQDCVLGIV